jgi:hypothetical protein
MVRQWSQSESQNPGGWQGSNWMKLGYDVYSFFPEFPPDGNPTNDPIGSVGSVGSASSELRVDYQATSNDFWRIVDEYQPRILITTSRGGGISWELEAVEGGHGSTIEPSEDWVSDRSGEHTLPTENSVDTRSWNAISTYRLGKTLQSQLPLHLILAATTNLAVADVQIDRGTSGNYLSGYIALHGLYYNRMNDHNVAAGHIHVGGAVSPDIARQLMETTLRTVLMLYPPTKCRERL